MSNPGTTNPAQPADPAWITGQRLAPRGPERQAQLERLLAIQAGLRAAGKAEQAENLFFRRGHALGTPQFAYDFLNYPDLRPFLRQFNDEAWTASTSQDWVSRGHTDWLSGDFYRKKLVKDLYRVYYCVGDGKVCFGSHDTPKNFDSDPCLAGNDYNHPPNWIHYTYVQNPRVFDAIAEVMARDARKGIYSVTCEQVFRAYGIRTRQALPTAIQYLDDALKSNVRVYFLDSEVPRGSFDEKANEKGKKNAGDKDWVLHRVCLALIHAEVDDRPKTRTFMQQVKNLLLPRFCRDGQTVQELEGVLGQELTDMHLTNMFSSPDDWVPALNAVREDKPLTLWKTVMETDGNAKFAGITGANVDRSTFDFSTINNWYRLGNATQGEGWNSSKAKGWGGQNSMATFTKQVGFMTERATTVNFYSWVELPKILKLGWLHAYFCVKRNKQMREKEVDLVDWGAQ